MPDGATARREWRPAAGVRRVVIACDDASVFAAGEGSERLKAAGVEVVSGLLEAEALPLYAAYRPASRP